MRLNIVMPHAIDPCARAAKVKGLRLIASPQPVVLAQAAARMPPTKTYVSTTEQTTRPVIQEGIPVGAPAASTKTVGNAPFVTAATVMPALAQAVAQASDESFTQKLINSRDFVADAAARARCATPSTDRSTRSFTLKASQWCHFTPSTSAILRSTAQATSATPDPGSPMIR